MAIDIVPHSPREQLVIPVSRVEALNEIPDVWEWSTADGGRIAQFTDLNGFNQQWQLAVVTGSPPPSSPPPGTWPTPTGQVAVNGTIPVSGTLDGGDAPVLLHRRRQPGGEPGPDVRTGFGCPLQNVIIGAPVGDGVHCSGPCTLAGINTNFGDTVRLHRGHHRQRRQPGHGHLPQVHRKQHRH